MNYKKFTWIGNKVSEEDMQRLYRLKQETRKPITSMVAEAVSEYIKKASQNQRRGVKMRQGISQHGPES